MMTNAEKSPLEKSVMLSLLAHLLFLGFFLISGQLFPSSALVYEQAIRVDLVGMPEKLKNLDYEKGPTHQEVTAEPLQKAPEPNQEPESAKKSKVQPQKDDGPTVNLEKKTESFSKSKQSEAFKKLKLDDKFAALEREALQEDALKKLNAQKNTTTFAGTDITSGKQLKGVARVAHDGYLETVEMQIKKNWSLPPWLARKNLQAQVMIKIDRDGHLLEKSLAKSSGNPSFDENALSAVIKASPYPAPPADSVGIVSGEGILIGFPE